MRQTSLEPDMARLAGGLYLAIAICGAFSIAYVPAQILVPGDPEATRASLLGQMALYRMGILADSAVILCEIAITAILFRLFQNEHPTLAVIAALARAGMIFVMGINLLFWLAPYVLYTGFPLQEADTLAMSFIEMHALGVFVWQIFFGAHLLALGTMILRGTAVPRLLGWGLSVGAFGYLVEAFHELTFSTLAFLDPLIISLLVVVSISEISFGLWLLVGAPRRNLANV